MKPLHDRPCAVTVPDLEPHCGSWICSNAAGAAVELYERADAERLARGGWRVETAAQYLGRVNAAIRARGRT